MEKVTLTKIFRSFTDKKGAPLRTSDGREYEHVAVQTREYASAWVSGFGAYWNQNWREGDIVELEITRVQKDGKEYLNFSRPSPIALLTRRVEALEDAFRALKTAPGRKEGVKDEEIPIVEEEPPEEPPEDIFADDEYREQNAKLAGRTREEIERDMP
jgi:hypothetical protein